MKKCQFCGAIQNDDRNQCIDCGARLGKPMSEFEEKATEDALDDKIDSLAEKTEPFYIPIYDKIMGGISLICIVLSIVLLFLAGAESQRIEDSVPEGLIITQSGSGISVIGGTDNFSEYIYPSARKNEIVDTSSSAIIALLSFVISTPLLIFPKAMWLLDTLKYRIFYNWDTTPSSFALTLRKVVAYIFFAVGVISTLTGYFIFF